jgi:hypothetical protein
MKLVSYISLARIGVKRYRYRILIGKSDGKKQLGIHRHRWEHNFKTDLKETWCEAVY